MREKYVVRPHHYALADGTPCELILDKNLHNEYKARKVAEMDKTPLPCKSPMFFELEFCMLRVTRLHEIINRLPQVATITKRNVLAEIARQAMKLAARVGAGATIFVKGMVKEVLDETADAAAKQLLSTVLALSKQQFSNRSIVPANLLKDEVGVVSLYAKERPDELNIVVSEINYEDKYVRYAYEELSAAETLLRALETHLKQGKMDTQALGELMFS